MTNLSNKQRRRAAKERGKRLYPPHVREALEERETSRPRWPDTPGMFSCSDLGWDRDMRLKSLGRGPCPKSGYNENCS